MVVFITIAQNVCPHVSQVVPIHSMVIKNNDLNKNDNVWPSVILVCQIKHQETKCQLNIIIKTKKIRSKVVSEIFKFYFWHIIQRLIIFILLIFHLKLLLMKHGYCESSGSIYFALLVGTIYFVINEDMEVLLSSILCRLIYA